MALQGVDTTVNGQTLSNVASASSSSASLQSNFQAIQNYYSQYILQPVNLFGLAGFVFDIEGETSMRLEADITDHYVEDNSAIQDHIALRPLKVTLKNYVGELAKTTPSALNTAQKLITKATTIVSYLPTLATAATEVYNNIQNGNLSYTNITSSASDLWSLVKNMNPFATKQQQAYQYFKALMQQKILINLQTPYEFIQNMSIESIVATQGEETKDISDFSITLKKIRTANVLVTQFDPNNFQSRVSQQAAPQTKIGKANGDSVAYSLTTTAVPRLKVLPAQ